VVFVLNVAYLVWYVGLVDPWREYLFFFVLPYPQYGRWTPLLEDHGWWTLFLEDRGHCLWRLPISITIWWHCTLPLLDVCLWRPKNIHFKNLMSPLQYVLMDHMVFWQEDADGILTHEGMTHVLCRPINIILKDWHLDSRLRHLLRVWCIILGF